MITLRPSAQRGHFDFGWLDTYHTFSFGHYHDREWMGFRSLRVINEDVVAPGGGFPTHPHENMEIITYVLSGSLAHRDSTGGVATISPGEVQRMTAGSGIQHSEFNASKTEPVHLMQIWLRPASRGLTPGYDQKLFPMEGRRNRLQLLVSPDASEGSILINQDARLYGSILDAGAKVSLPLAPGRHAWVQVARGEITVNGQTLRAGDGAGLSEEPRLDIAAAQESELVVFDLA
ncbi:MAG: pirin family protein [Planctomycetes bacterium]|nr:pirin family protein [Planctomycetota bacterium]